MELFKEQFLTIIYNQQIGCMHMRWTGFASTANYRRGMNLGLEKVKEKQVSKWLADMSTMGVITIEDQKWTNVDWFPRLLDAGIRTAAVVLSQDVFNQMAVKKVAEDMHHHSYTMHFFDSLEEANTWLKMM